MTEMLTVGTGLSSALGKALMGRLSSETAVLALGRTEIQAPRVHWISVDFRQPTATWSAPVIAWLRHQKPSVSAFVHASGVVYSDVVERTTLDEWEATWRVNVASAFKLGQVLSPYLADGASVVLVGSVDAWYASQDGPAAAYGASKAALLGLVRHWASEWGPRGIRVNGVAPGALTSGNGPSAQFAENITGRIALQRLGQPGEVADVIQFLLSPQAAYITGAWIPVDGGLNIRY